jgi:general secretion pathway protein N
MIASLRAAEMSLLGVALVLGLLITGILGGLADSPDWLPERAPRNLIDDAGKTHVAPNASLQSLSTTWQAPLFSTDRSPDRSTQQAQASNLAGLTLTGVMIDGDLRVALIKRADGPPLKIHQGQALPNGWTLDKLTPLQADFSSDGRTQSLSLRAPRLPPPSNTPPISLPRESTP